MSTTSSTTKACPRTWAASTPPGTARIPAPRWSRPSPTRTRRRGTSAGVNTTGDENYVILDTEGAGHYVGCVLNIDNFDASNQVYTWPGEGDDMIFIDGEAWPPSMHGTGTEDYFGMAWGFPSRRAFDALSRRLARLGRAGTFRQVEPLPLPHRGSGAFLEVDPRDHRARPRQRPGQRLLSVAYWYQTEAVAAEAAAACGGAPASAAGPSTASGTADRPLGGAWAPPTSRTRPANGEHAMPSVELSVPHGTRFEFWLRAIGDATEAPLGGPVREPDRLAGRPSRCDAAAREVHSSRFRGGPD